MSLLENKTAIVTGATSGIGRAIALNLARSGAHVFLTGRDAERLEEVARMIRQEGGLASVEAFDLRESDRLQTFVAAAAKEAGRLDIMVNAAGVDHPGTIADGGHTEWRDMFEINVIAMLVGSQAGSAARRNILKKRVQQLDAGCAVGHAGQAAGAPLLGNLQKQFANVACKRFTRP